MIKWLVLLFLHWKLLIKRALYLVLLQSPFSPSFGPDIYNNRKKWDWQKNYSKNSYQEINASIDKNTIGSRSLSIEMYIYIVTTIYVYNLNMLSCHLWGRGLALKKDWGKEIACFWKENFKEDFWTNGGRRNRWVESKKKWWIMERLFRKKKTYLLNMVKNRRSQWAGLASRSQISNSYGWSWTETQLIKDHWDWGDADWGGMIL